MKIKGKSIRISNEKRKTFPAAVSELADKDQESKLVIYEKTGIKNKYLDEVPIIDVVDIAGDIERVLNEEHGGGEYQLSLFNKDSEVVEKFSYSIAGEPKGRRSSGDKESRKENRSTSEERYYGLLDRLTEAAMSNKGSSGDEFHKTLELVKELRGDDGNREFEKELLTILLNNLVQSNGSDLDNALQIIEISHRLQPELQREDPLTSLAQTVMPLIGQLIAAKQGGSTPAVDPNLREQIRQALAQYQGSSIGSPDMGHPAAPGDSHIRAADSAPGASRLGGPVEMAQEQASEAPTPPLAASHEYFQKRFLRPFQEDAADDQPAEDLAYQIVSMVQYARDRMAENPPPLVAGFLTAGGPLEYDAALSGFFAAIPELANLTQKCASIRSALIAMFSGPGQGSPVEDIENAQSAAGTHADQPDSALDSAEVQPETVSNQV